MDYSFPLGNGGGPGFDEPPPLMPEASARQAPGLAEQPFSLPELEIVLGEQADNQEAELTELSQWFNSLPDSEKQQALASVAKTLSFTAEPAPLPTQPGHSAAAPEQAPPPFTVYADPALMAPAASVVAAPAAVAGRGTVLQDRTNLLGASEAPSKHGKTSHLKQLSSRLHVAHSKKIAPTVRLNWQGLGSGLTPCTHFTIFSCNQR